MSIDSILLAKELAAASSTATPVTTPTSRDAAFDVSAGHAVEAELVRMRRAAGHHVVGLKVGYANKALWRALKLETLLWASMYEDTVHRAPYGQATLALGRRYAPRIEPEVVFSLKAPLAGTADPAVALAAVDWIALGFEIIDCPYPDWKFQPADFLAAFGLHAGLVIGPPVAVTDARIPSLVDALPAFTVRLLRHGEVVDEGSGRNVLKSPALCLGELAGAVARHSGGAGLDAGEIITTGTLTTAQPIAAGQQWRVEVAGLELSPLTLTLA